MPSRPWTPSPAGRPSRSPPRRRLPPPPPRPPRRARRPPPRPPPRPPRPPRRPPAGSPPPPAPPAPAPTPAPAAPIGRIAAPPALRHLRIGGSLRGRQGKIRVTFSLTRSAAVGFTVTRRGSRKPAATWSARGRSGANAFSLTRRLPTRKTLARGSYTLSVGLTARAASARFSVR